jgi:hypothetical protein
VPRSAGEAGVGLFEGSYYRATGYFRPTDNSFMRSLSTNMGAVNAERWVKSIYQRMGAVRDVTPASSTPSVPAGTTLALGVTLSLGAPLQEVRWYQDGIEVSSLRGSTTFTCCTVTSGAHAVRVTVAEVSGLVKDPNPGPTYYERTWQISFN